MAAGEGANWEGARDHGEHDQHLTDPLAPGSPGPSKQLALVRRVLSTDASLGGSTISLDGAFFRASISVAENVVPAMACHRTAWSGAA
jgi:hypothetical protein